MKKLFISADIEGTCGIADWKETDLSDPQGAVFRSRMTDEVAAACEAATDSGVQEVFVKDAHGSGRSIEIAALPETVRLLRGWPGDPAMMMSGLEPDFGGVAFTGYHSGASSAGNPLAHTMNGSIVRATLDGLPLSEFDINMRTAAALGVPILVLSGDRELCEKAEALNLNIQTVPVSEGKGNATVAIHPSLARKRIGEAVARAIQATDSNLDTRARLLPLPPSFELLTTYREHGRAYQAAFFPGAKAVGSHEVLFRAATWQEVLVFMLFAW